MSRPEPVPVFICLAILWLAGTALRMTILALPPLIPLIHDDLHMSQTAVGVLTGLPPVLFAAAAVPAALLIARFGALPTLVIGLLATGFGSALRALAFDLPVLYGATIVTAFGVAVMQPSLPPLVRAWLPQRVGFGTAVYTNGLLVGEVVAVGMTLPVVLPLTGSWRLSLVAWGLPCLAIALVVFALAPRPGETTVIAPGPRRWWPDWHSPMIWRLGVMLGTVNAMYFTAVGFIPDYLDRSGMQDFIAPTLTVLNLAQIPASVLLLFYTGRWVSKTSSYLICGVVCIVSFLGIMFGSGPVILVSAAAFGAVGTAVLVFMLTLPALVGPPDDVHRITAGMFTISYSCAVVVPVLAGLAWDLTGAPVSAFIPVLASAFVLMALAPSVRLPPPRTEAGN
jgi:CP family cyanate transporter-like MFS transporter